MLSDDKNNIGNIVWYSFNAIYNKIICDYILRHPTDVEVTKHFTAKNICVII